jgi:hypothetical protein
MRMDAASIAHSSRRTRMPARTGIGARCVVGVWRCVDGNFPGHVDSIAGWRQRIAIVDGHLQSGRRVHA